MRKPFPGTITLTAETYMRVLSEVVKSPIKQGVKRVDFWMVMAATSYLTLQLAEIREMIYYKYGVDIEVGTLSHWNVVHDEVLEVASEQRIGHGGEAKTSVLMAIALTPFEPIILYRPTQDLGLSLKYFELIIRMSIVQMDTPMMHG